MPGVVIVSGDPVTTAAPHAASEKTLYVTVPVAVEAVAPLNVAESVTAVLGRTPMLPPDFPPPESVVDTAVGLIGLVTVSTSVPHGLVTGLLSESPE